MASPSASPSASLADLPIRRIRLWQHWRAVGQILRDYPPGADALVDQVRSVPGVVRFLLRSLAGPLYFAREQGWMVRGPRGELAAMMYLRRQERAGVRVMHVDDINVSALYLRQGLAQRLLNHAEALAREERRPFLKLAVTVANTPAVTLYRRLGYEEQHHRFFTFAPSSLAVHTQEPPDLMLRRLGRKRARDTFEQFYRLEMMATAPAVADLVVTYYQLGGSDVSGVKTAQRGYVIERSGQAVGFGDVYRQKAQWHLRLSLDPELWGTDVERQALRLLTGVIGGSQDAAVTLSVPSAGHFDALCAGPQSFARMHRLSEHIAARMIMVKPLAGAS